jgi:4-amino-4-deoxy-L-arabinose transferase-like glycosyltransferase
MRTQFSNIFDNKKFYLAAVILVLMLFSALAIGTAIAERPQIDEGMFASPALNLATKGFMGTTVLETQNSPLKHIEQRTYWVMPLYLLNQALWYKLFGFSLLTMRALSAFWGLIGLLSWFLIMLKLSGDKKIALLTLFLLAFDYTYINGAAMGRMDLMSAALGFAALASYLALRERNLKLAILLSQSCVVLSGLTHPNGIMAFAGLLFLTLYFDRRSITWSHVGAALIPYLVGAAGFGWWVMKDVPAFKAQFIDNAVMKGRLGGFSAPWVGVIREFTERYPHAFGLGGRSEGHAGPVYLKSLILIAYALGVIGALVTPSIRRNRNYRALLILAGIYFLIMSLIDGQKETPYLVHIIPLYLALLAVWLHWAWTTRFVPAPLIAVGLCGLIALQVGGTMLRIKQDTYHKLYMPAIAFLKENTTPQTTIMGSSALGFGLGFPDNLVDDGRFGYASGRRPEIIVFGEESELSLREAYAFYPQLPPYINRLLSEEYKQIYANPSFKIYARR